MTPGTQGNRIPPTQDTLSEVCRTGRHSRFALESPIGRTPIQRRPACPGWRYSDRQTR
jgi:hypothetical protein